jgi:hypothetical protein
MTGDALESADARGTHVHRRRGEWGTIMFNRRLSLAALAGAVCLQSASMAKAQVGEPTGSFGIRITHGGTTIVDYPAVPLPADFKLSDGDPEDFIQIGTIGPNAAPIILKVVSDDDPGFRIVHFYVDVPGNLADIHHSDGDSLFAPSDSGLIDVSITGLSFAGTTQVTPMLANNSTYLAAYMRDTYMGTGGRFYDLPEVTYVPPGVIGPEAQGQVAGEKFYDGDLSQYVFTGSFEQPTASFTWGAIPNPGAVSSQVINADGSLSPGDGKVFELGLSVAFVGVPEPGTIGLVASGLWTILTYNRRRR